MGAALVEMAALGREAQRQREYEFPDSVSVENDRTARRCDMPALEMSSTDGDMKEARLLLRGVLSRVKDCAPIYRAWIDMELETEHGGDGVVAARCLFDEWETSLRRAADAADADAKRDADIAKDERVAAATKDEMAAKAELAADVAKYERADYWCAYIVFEVHHGTAELARNAAERAARACPDDELVLAMCAKVQEVALAKVVEQKRRHRLGLVRGAKKLLGTIFVPTSTPPASRAAAAGCRGVRAGS